MITVLFSDPEEQDCIQTLKCALADLKINDVEFIESHDGLLERLVSSPPEFVFNLSDGGFKNDVNKELHIPALLELLGCRYSGADPICLATCRNKHHVASIMKRYIPTPEEFHLLSNDLSQIQYPAFIKPNAKDGSCGIHPSSVVNDEVAARSCIEILIKSIDDILIQEYLDGAEYSVGIIGNGPYHVLPILTIDYGQLPAELPKILCCDAKWNSESPYYQSIRCNQCKDPAIIELLSKRAIMVYRMMGCRDYARIDFRADSKGEIKLLEVNPNPCWYAGGSEMHDMIKFAGLQYCDLIEMMLDAAMKRLPSCYHEFA